MGDFYLLKGGFSISRTKSHWVKELTSGNSWSLFWSTIIIFSVGGSKVLLMLSNLLFIEDNSLGFYCDVKTIKSVSTDGVLSQWFNEGEI